MTGDLFNESELPNPAGEKIPSSQGNARAGEAATGDSPVLSSAHLPEPGLNAAQLAFLRFHADGDPPHQWEWLDAEGRGDPSPDAAATLRARKREGSGLRHLLISAEDLAGLAPYWVRPLEGVNAAGLALIHGPAGRRRKAGARS